MLIGRRTLKPVNQILVFAISLVLAATSSNAEEEKDRKSSLPDSWSQQIPVRSIGPANMSGRITAIAVYEKDPSIWWAASASGGLLKTTNNGVKFEHQFDDQPTVSIGDVQVSKTDPDLVWVGTGEANPRNSVSWGDGVYKSTDGGKTWKNMGLKEIFQTGRIAIHPKDHNIVYVGALGRLWGPNEERGLYKTTDGGETWEKVLYVDDKTGVVDVQMNPKNPDELLVATYERLRDGFDGNDPVKKYGPGSAIYKTTDGGKSFARISKGLPSCDLGRIGLNYFHRNPQYVAAIIESEQIAKEPENAPFAGIRGADAEVGARISNVTRKGPAEKAGLQENDIVISIDGKVVLNYSELAGAIREHQAGDTVKLLVSREGKQVDVVMELGDKPKRKGRDGKERNGRSPFTGTLGGQAANMQGQQGENEQEFGGVYLSMDGGDSWERINTLNPRPMYYSQVRFDPSDRKKMYVLGTSLYRSTDGGRTFTGDGGRGIHPDNHALWINPKDGRHMILGNDGGIYVTWDRMDNWDHHNHVAIGQFYHAGIGSRINYRVYGGLQDNGSWGGPARVSNAAGPENSDWFRVGGGDGFITLADPDDPDQIYFESQNGGMGRINLRTGERGFIRPRPPRGSKIKYRFNWKTPFILSPHNSRIHYSAGNFVFRSLNKGAGIKAISPEITNSDKGAGSAISESPLEAGVIYVGTTDGAVWMTRDGGQEWVPIFSTPQDPENKGGDDPADDNGNEDEKDESSSGESSDEGDDEPGDKADQESDEQSESRPNSESEAAENSEPKTDTDDPISGSWKGSVRGEQIPNGEIPFTLELKLDGESLTGNVESERGEMEIVEGDYKAGSKRIYFFCESDGLFLDFEATLEGNTISGDVVINDSIEAEFEAMLEKRADDPERSEQEQEEDQNNQPEEQPEEKQSETSGDDRDDAAGQQPERGFLGVMVDEELNVFRVVSGSPAEQAGVQQRDQIDSIDGESIEDRDALLRAMQMKKSGQQVQLLVRRNEEKVSLDVKLGSPPSQTPRLEPSQTQEPADVVDVPIETEPALEPSKPDDGVTGTWQGTIESPRGESELTISVKLNDKGEFSGEYRTPRSDGEIASGAFDREQGTLSLSADSGQFTLDFIGEVDGDSYSGEVEFNGGTFTMPFNVKRISKQPTKEQDEETSEQSNDGSKPLSELLPGPRWASSLHASRFSDGRCYITFDGHRSNDDDPHLFVTENFGKTWKSIRGNLPLTAGSARVLREDRRNENLLYLGCEFGGWVSIDRGATWSRLKNLPTVAVHEFAQHPTLDDVAIGTHGRSLWIADVSWLRQSGTDPVSAENRLFRPREIYKWRSSASRGSSGTRKFVGASSQASAKIYWSHGDNVRSIELEVRDLQGNLTKRFENLPTRKGLHSVDWDLRQSNASRGRFGPRVSAGEYLVELRVDGALSRESMVIHEDPELPADAAAESQEWEWWLEQAQGESED